MNGFGFGFSDQLAQASTLSGGSTPASSAPEQGSNLTQAEQLAIAQTAIDSGLKVFSAIFGAILSVDQQSGLATTQDGSQVPYDQLGEVSATDTTGQVVYVTDTGEKGFSYTNIPWVIAGVAVVGALFLGLRR
tara:strand:+ start:265 stop:663 length:399 start_codon:yes stop_codon:yes gene_type:complete